MSPLKTIGPSWNYVFLSLYLIFAGSSGVAAQVLGDPVDVSEDFRQPQNVYFVGSRVKNFDPATGIGSLIWDRYLQTSSLNFNKVDIGLSRGKATEFPATEYDQDPALPFSISFVTPRTIRLRFNAQDAPFDNEPSLMLIGEPPVDHSWKVEQNDKATTYTSAF